MDNLCTRLQFEPLRSLGFASIGGAYTQIGVASVHSSRVIYLQNLTDANVMISFDPTIGDTLPLAANGFFLLDITSNQAGINGFHQGKDVAFWVKTLGAAPTSGSVYVTTFFGTRR